MYRDKKKTEYSRAIKIMFHGRLSKSLGLGRFRFYLDFCIDLNGLNGEGICRNECNMERDSRSCRVSTVKPRVSPSCWWNLAILSCPNASIYTPFLSCLLCSVKDVKVPLWLTAFTISEKKKVLAYPFWATPLSCAHPLSRVSRRGRPKFFQNRFLPMAPSSEHILCRDPVSIVIPTCFRFLLS